MFTFLYHHAGQLSSDLTRQETLKTQLEGVWGGKRPPQTPTLIEELTDR